MPKILVVFYSMYGHVHRLAEAIAEGAGQVEGAEVKLRRVPETIPRDVLERAGAWEAHQRCATVPECLLDDLVWADATLFGTPTRYGNMTGQMRQFLDTTGGLWLKRALVGKIGSVFVSGNTQHGGQESTILSFHPTLLHHGMIIVGLPYLFETLLEDSRVVGGSPYGATSVTGQDIKKMPSEDELAGARFQGRYVALLAKALAPHCAGIVDALKT